MRAAIYARKSTDDSDRSTENKSVTRQVEHARAYAQDKGWSIDDENVFIDDGISGAEYVNRPGLARLMASLKRFDVLVMSESSRLGRDMTRNAAYVVNIIESGVKIFYYLSDEEERADTPEQKVMLTLRSYASEVERLKAAQRSRDALARKAAKGYNAGGSVYGYDNVAVYANDGETKSHTDYRVNAEQADVIRRIFRMYAAGHGLVSVAKTLNGDPRYAELSRRYFDARRPASPRKGTGSWAPSSVRALLHNERYTGIVPFGVRRKVYRGGTKARVKQPESEVLRALRPDLRIVDDTLWRETQARLASVRKTYVRDTNGKLWGRPGTGVESKHLLSGLGTCGCCGHNITMVGGRTGSPGKRAILMYYGCAYHQNRGSTVCANDYRARLRDADAVVIERIRQSILTPEAIDFIIEEAIGQLAQRQREDADAPKRLEAEIRRERGQLANLVRALETSAGKDPASVVARIQALETSIGEKQRELATLRVSTPPDRELNDLRRSLRERLDRFEELLLSDVPVARQALRKLIDGRIEFRPDPAHRRYHLRWTYKLQNLVEEGYIGVATPREFEPRLPP